MKKGNFLRRSGFFFRSAAEESRIKRGNSANTPGPSKPQQPKTKLRAEENVRDTKITRKQTMKRMQTEREESKKKKKLVLDINGKESEEEDENERANERRDQRAVTTSATNTASGEN